MGEGKNGNTHFRNPEAGCTKFDTDPGKVADDAVGTDGDGQIAGQIEGIEVGGKAGTVGGGACPIGGRVPRTAASGPRAVAGAGGGCGNEGRDGTSDKIGGMAAAEQAEHGFRFHWFLGLGWESSTFGSCAGTSR